MTDDDKPKLAEGPMGQVNGQIQTWTPEQYEAELRKRNAQELEDPEDADDDLSDLGELGELFDNDDEEDETLQ